MASQTLDDTRMLNETFFEFLSTPGLEKKAADAINDFTRSRMREDGWWRKVIPPQNIGNDELDRQISDKPYKIVDKEPNSPAAITIPFAALPMNLYIRAPRYIVGFARIVTPRFVKDVDELRTYHMDVRQVLSDNSMKDALTEEDTKAINAVDAVLVGADQIVPQSGVVQWETVPGGISRDSVQDAFKILPRTPAHLEVNTVLINNVSIREVMKWGRDEMGGDFSQDVLKNGWSEQEFMRAKWIITIKRDLVPDDSIYMFADPKFIGKNFLLEDMTMYVKREAYMLEFFSYMTIGGAIANSSGVARADFV